MLNARTALSPRTPIVIHLHVHPKREHVVKPYAASSKRSYKCGKSICVLKKKKKNNCQHLSTISTNVSILVRLPSGSASISLKGIPRFGSAVLISIAVKAADSTPTGTKPGAAQVSARKWSTVFHRSTRVSRSTPLRRLSFLKLNQTTAVRASGEATLASQHSHAQSWPVDIRAPG